MEAKKEKKKKKKEKKEKKRKEKVFNKIQHAFLIKVLEQVGLLETYSNIIKIIYNKLMANIILNE
jgi:6-pyruvoyl-tetrahydropterin synthase